MTFFSAIPTPETQVGIAIETERGVALPPEFWLPVSGPKYKPDLQLLPDNAMRGSMVTLYDEVPGLRFDSYAWDSFPYLDTLPVLLRSLLGSPDTVTAAPAATKLKKAVNAGDTEIELEPEVNPGYAVIGDVAGHQETVLITNKASKQKLAHPLAFPHAINTTVAGLTSHAFSLLNNAPGEGNQPPSCTITDYAGETDWRALPAAQLDTLHISGAADSLPKVATSWFADKAVTPEAPVASFSTAEAPPGWTVQASVGGVNIGYLVNWEFDMKRGVKNVPAITGTQNYYQHFAGPLDVTGKLVVLEDPAATWLTAYENGELETIDLTLSDVDSGFALNLHTTKSKFTSGDLDRSKEYVEVPLAFQTIPSSTDATAGGVSPVKATVANARTEEY